MQYNSIAQILKLDPVPNSIYERARVRNHGSDMQRPRVRVKYRTLRARDVYVIITTTTTNCMHTTTTYIQLPRFPPRNSYSRRNTALLTKRYLRFSISQSASTMLSGTIESNQYFPLTASPPSLALISWHDSAASSGMEPRGTKKENNYQKE